MSLAKTTIPLFNLFLTLSAKSLNEFPSTSFNSAVTNSTPFISTLSFKISSSAPWTNLALSSAISLSFSFNSWAWAAILLAISFSLHLSIEAASLSILFLSSMNFNALIPVTASILLIPAATPDSETILNNPISPELATWVPPHNSFEKSPTETTLTFSAYFSSKRQVAPLFLASSNDISFVSTTDTVIIFSFTNNSTFSNSSSVKAAKWVKSNLNLSSSTYEPDWFTWSPKTSFKASCNMCVAVWFLHMLDLLEASTDNLTSWPSFKLPSITLM